MKYDSTGADYLAYHREMLADRVRIDTYFRAVMTAVQPGDVVVDIGTGTGVLAYFACMAGARKVYAIEQGQVGDLAEELCRHNGFGDRVEVVGDWSTAVELPEPADVVMTETIGNAGFEEGIVGWIVDARTRLLKPGGTVVPGRMRMMVAPVDDPYDYIEIDEWSTPRRGIDFSPARERAARELWFVDLSPAHLLSEPDVGVDVDLHRVAADAQVAAFGVAEARREGTLHGLGCWFEADLADGISLTNAPPNPVPSWAHTLLPIADAMPVYAGQRLDWSVEVADNGGRWSWSVSPAAEPTATA